MNLARLHEIIQATTCQLRKGEEVEHRQVGSIKVIEVFAMPHVDEMTAPDVEKIDMVFLVVAVDRAKAEAHKDELIALLKTYPDPKRLLGGPSYIEVGAVIGDQGAALQLFALGKVLKLWDVMTPAALGFKDEQEQRRLAGMGMLMISVSQAGAAMMAIETARLYRFCNGYSLVIVETPSGKMASLSLEKHILWTGRLEALQQVIDIISRERMN